MNEQLPRHFRIGARFALPLLAAIAAALLIACGGASDAPSGEREAAPTASDTGAGQTALGIGRELEGVEITVDECAWKTPEGGGDPALNVTFTLDNGSGEQLFTTYRLQDSSGSIYKKAGVGSDLTVNDGETGTRTLTTDKFAPGAEDVALIVSIERFQDRTHETIPLEQCAGP